MDFPTHFVFSAIAFIAHKVTKNAYSTTLILHCNANIVFNANKSVHYHHCSNGYSCHGRVEPVTVSDLGVTSAEANRVFTITILTMEIAATVMLNGLFVLPCGFMYSRSPLGHHLLGRRLLPLHTSSYQRIKRKYGIITTGARRRNCESSKICLRRL